MLDATEYLAKVTVGEGQAPPRGANRPDKQGI